MHSKGHVKFPVAFEQRMQQQLGGQYQDFVEAHSQKAPVSIRFNAKKPANATKTDRNNRVPWCASACYLDERPVFTLDPYFHAGAYYVQEAGSMFTAYALNQILDATRRICVLDLCAAPGGKSTLLSELNCEKFIVANEPIRNRYNILKENLTRWGWSNYAITSLDPAQFKIMGHFFDVVLVDAPCSGEGLFRKDARAISEWSEDHLKLCSSRQRRILSELSSIIKPGGLLVYSTCTYNPDENLEQVKWLCNTGQYESIELQLDESWGIEYLESNQCFAYQFMPHKTKTEGFFLSVLRYTGVEQEAVSKSRKMKKARTSYYSGLEHKMRSELENYVILDDHYLAFNDPSGNIFVIPETYEAEFLALASGLRKIEAIGAVGCFKGKNFVPDHALALTAEMKVKIPEVQLDRRQCLMFLKKVLADLDLDNNGWYKVCYGSNGLGWIKKIDSRINNYLPKNYMIRMDIQI